MGKNKFIYLLWTVLILLIISILILRFFKGTGSIISILVSLAGIVAMLAIALHTFLKMDNSTKETIGAIMQSSKKELEEFGGFVQKTKETNIILNGVAKSLEIVSRDVEIRQKQKPNLYVSFGGDVSRIDLQSNIEKEITFILKNTGPIGANNPNWMIYFPSGIEVIKADGDIIPQPLESKYKYYTGVGKTFSVIAAHAMLSIKVNIKSTLIGLTEIPFDCCSSTSPENEDKLLINFIG